VLASDGEVVESPATAARQQWSQRIFGHLRTLRLQHQIEVHHIRALKDLNPKGRKQPPEWVVRMASRRRKTLVVCRACHEGIHYSGSASRQT
jgi:hypothetical protein